jgi:parallel beta-helix repeat protein
VLCSDPPGAAKLDGKNMLTTGFYLEGTFVHVLGFEVTGFVNAGASVWSKGGALVGNVIHDIGHVCSDSDQGKVGIYTTTTDVLINGNVIHSIGRLSPGDQGCMPTTTNYQNHDHGIYVESSTNVVVTNNVFFDNNHGWDIHVYTSTGPGSSGLTILNNTFAFPSPYRDGHILFATPVVSDARVENNIFYKPRTEGVHFGGGTYSKITITNNLTTGAPTTATAPATAVVNGNYDSVDALLVSPNTDDFHLQPMSPAIDHGVKDPAVMTDIDGTPRPQGSAVDIGAYEWH